MTVAQLLDFISQSQIPEDTEVFIEYVGQFSSGVQEVESVNFAKGAEGKAVLVVSAESIGAEK